MDNTWFYKHMEIDLFLQKDYGLQWTGGLHVIDSKKS